VLIINHKIHFFIFTQLLVIQRVLTFLVLCTFSSTVLAQWLDFPTPGIPRTAAGGPDMTAPAPRTSDNKPDFTGIWFSNVPSVDTCAEEGCITEERMAREQINLGLGLPDGLPYTQWSLDIMVDRRANSGREDPHTYCMPPNFPRAYTLPQYMKVVQTPDLIVMLHEFNAAYRQIFMDGRQLQDDPNPTWNGYSIGYWEGDTLVIETNGIRDDMWLDLQGSPVTESAHVTERLTRTEFGLMHIEITVDDPTAYTESWTVTIEHAIQVDTMLLEEICLDDEQDVELYQ
jgi:hypothetical protein